MTRGTRALVILLATGTMLMVAAVGAVAASVYTAGSIAVELEEPDGSRVNVRVPAGLANLAIGMTPSSVVRECAEEVEPWMVAAARAGWEELAKTPDFVLVEVESDDESVRIEKKGQHLIIVVDEPSNQVNISVPLRTVGKFFSKLDSSRS